MHYGEIRERSSAGNPENPPNLTTNHHPGSASTSSGGQSGDERWYDFGDAPPSSSENSPPPLPNRLLVGGGKGSAFQKVNNTSNVIISGSGGSVLSNVTVNGHHSSSSNNSSPSIYQHPPPPKLVNPLGSQMNPHGSQHSNGGLINPHHGSQQSIGNGNKRVSRKYSYPAMEEKREAKVTYLTEFELNNQPNINGRDLTNNLSNGNHANHLQNNQSNGREVMSSTADQSHRVNGRGYHIRSEDELSAVSTSKTILKFSFYKECDQSADLSVVLYIDSFTNGNLVIFEKKIVEMMNLRNILQKKRFSTITCL